MKFRPCIDIHNGQVKQIVGGSLKDMGDEAFENFVSKQDATFYAKLYKESMITGGHIILLNPPSSSYYKETKNQALQALQAYEGGLQIGGGITSDNAREYLDAGASHVIVTSYVFQDGKIAYDRLFQLVDTIGKDNIVLDLSCRKKDDLYYIVTNRWQTYTDTVIDERTLQELSKYCDEFLIHAVDVEGKASGIEKQLVTKLAQFSPIPTTYAGGVGSFLDLQELRSLGNNRLDVTIGSALDLFGGPMSYEKVRSICD